MQDKISFPPEHTETSQWQIFNEITVALGKAKTLTAITEAVTASLNKMGYSVAVGRIYKADAALKIVKIAILSDNAVITELALSNAGFISNIDIPFEALPCYETSIQTGSIEFITLSPTDVRKFLGVVALQVQDIVFADQQQYISVISIPIRIEESIDYVIFISAPNISSADIPRVTAFANLTSAMLERYVLHQRTEEQKYIAQTLQEVGKIVSSSLNLDTVLTLILEQLATVIEYDSSSILLEENNSLKLEAGSGFERGDQVLDIAVPVDTNILYQKMKQNRQPITINDVHADPRYDLWAGTAPIRSWIGVPLIWQDDVIGQISVDSFKQNAFTNEEGALVFTFAQHVATAIQNARLYQQVTQTANELRILLDSARDVTTTLDTEKIVYLLAGRVKSLMQADAVAVFLQQDENKTLDMVAYLSDKDDVIPGIENVINQAIAGATGVIMNPKVNGCSSVYDKDAQKKAIIAVPFVVNNQAIGAIVMYRCDDAIFEQSDLDLLTRFALQSGIAIENSRLYNQVEQRLRREGLLNQLSRRMSSRLSLEIMVKDIMQTAQIIVQADAAALILNDPAQKGKYLQFTHNLQAENHPSHIETVPGIVSHIMRKQKVIVSQNLAAEPYATPPWIAIDVKGIIGIPLTSNNITLGVLGAFTFHHPFSHSKEILSTLEAVGRQAGVSIENALLFKQINEYAGSLEEQVEARTAEIRTQKEQLDAILAGAADAIVITSAEGIIQYVNPAYTNLTGYFPEEAIGQPSNILNSSQTSPHVYQQMWRTILSGKVWRGELKNKRKDGSIYDAGLSIAPIFNYTGQIDKFVAIQRDISKLRELDRLKTEFLGTAAHELRNPLTTIRGYSELLLTREGFNREEIMCFVNDIHESAVHLANLITDLLDVSKIESGAAFGISPELINPRQIFERTVNVWQERTDKHQIQLLEPDEWPEVKVDPARLEQVIENLISNAIKYSPAGGPITVSINRSSANLRVSISDQGIGMTTKEQKRIFEKFWRADASSTAIEGTGLGMVIVKHIIESHGGKIWLSSRKNEGATISFTIPLIAGIATILIIEDETSILEVQERLLAIEGYHILTSRTGARGLTLALDEHPDLIILDLMLPETNGEDILRKLKATPATEHIPVVIVSAKAGLAHIENTFALGAADFITKPFDIDEYLGRIKIALNK